ncbi:hypothetical protein ACT89R_01705 [Rhodococcus qingshengii]
MSTSKTAEYVLLVTQFDQQIQKKGEPVEYRRYRRGDTLALSSAEAARLLDAKAIAPATVDDPDPDPDTSDADAGADVITGYGAAVGADNAQFDTKFELPSNPADLTSPPAVEPQDNSVAQDGSPADGKAAPLERPKLTATRIVWEQYALERGIDAEALSAMTKREEVIAAVDALDSQS